MKEFWEVDNKVEDWKVGKTLRDVRRWKNYTQAELGKKIGKSQSEISKLELGKMSMNMRDIESVCSKFYGLSVENFTEGTPINWSQVR